MFQKDIQRGGSVDYKVQAVVFVKKLLAGCAAAKESSAHALIPFGLLPPLTATT